jgi:hypothetical protein
MAQQLTQGTLYPRYTPASQERVSGLHFIVNLNELMELIIEAQLFVEKRNSRARV